MLCGSTVSCNQFKWFEGFAKNNEFLSYQRLLKKHIEQNFMRVLVSCTITCINHYSKIQVVVERFSDNVFLLSFFRKSIFLLFLKVILAILWIRSIHVFLVIEGLIGNILCWIKLQKNIYTKHNLVSVFRSESSSFKKLQSNWSSQT